MQSCWNLYSMFSKVTVTGKFWGQTAHYSGTMPKCFVSLYFLSIRIKVLRIQCKIHHQNSSPTQILFWMQIKALFSNCILSSYDKHSLHVLVNNVLFQPVSSDSYEYENVLKDFNLTMGCGHKSKANKSAYSVSLPTSPTMNSNWIGRRMQTMYQNLMYIVFGLLEIFYL